MTLDVPKSAFWIVAGIIILVVIVMLAGGLGGTLFDYTKALFGGLS